MMREPSFWWHERRSAALALAPLAAAYGAVAQARLSRRGYSVAVPVVCIGNLTVGGAGKTPAAIATAQILKAAGELPMFLTRGYGGSLPGPIAVDPAGHGAGDVGDEPLLLAATAPTTVARDRVAGANFSIARGATVIVMDDGFQNPALRKNLSILVVDGRRGIGNGCVIPAGPLRAPLAAQLRRAQVLVLVGTTTRVEAVAADARKRGIAVLGAQLRPDPQFVAALGAGRVLAFAGIGDPEKFFRTLADAGIAVAATRGFPDHHRYTREEAQALCEEADREGHVLVTTEKDLARLRGDDSVRELAEQAHALPVALTFEDEDRLRSLLLERLSRARSSPACSVI
jgi:tetraacyldisaccharide 4'-kinase